MTKVLLVGDESETLHTVRAALSARGYEVTTAATGAAALREAADERPDAVILDIGLPDMSGNEVLTGLRAWMTAPVLVLSGLAKVSDEVQAFDAGADDFMTKPVAMEEFLARLRAILRRAATAGDIADPIVETAAFSVDLRTTNVTRKGAHVHLTRTEWVILDMLVRNRGKLVRRSELLNRIRGPIHPTANNYLRVHIANLRRKLEEDPAHPEHLITETGLGYRFQESALPPGP
jgi:two-component system, OmpR family, KDP operon response regulator KdpE